MYYTYTYTNKIYIYTQTCMHMHLFCMLTFMHACACLCIPHLHDKLHARDYAHCSVCPSIADMCMFVVIAVLLIGHAYMT